MKKEDLRSRIIPSTIGNTDEVQHKGNKKFNTTDFIYLDSYDDQYDYQKTDDERRISATDYAKMNQALVFNDYTTRTGEPASWAWLRTACDAYSVYSVFCNGDYNVKSTEYISIGICPSLHYGLSSKNYQQSKFTIFNRQKNEEPEQFDIRKVKDKEGKTIYHTLQIGEFPKTKADEDLSKTLEYLYNGGKIKEGITCTGRWYSNNGQKETYADYAGKHSPEFEYKGERYVRVVSNPSHSGCTYLDGTPSGKKGSIRWTKVEPISFVIKNWDQMPQSINPKGNGRAKYFDLRAEEVITANIPFYPDDVGRNCAMWQNSTIRGFLNGIDVRNISSNGNKEYGASHGGNFTGKCNFLNEAFNLSRKPMLEYTIPESETEIPDDAFNGCITLKKLVIHPKIKYIGRDAFAGLEFKYAYRTETGELVFAQELPKNKNRYKDVVELGKIAKAFYGFDYNILLQNNELSEVDNLLEVLGKNKFSIPCVYGLALVKSENTRYFTENSDFRYFKNEIPKINDILLDFPEEERLDFFKFANSLGCFSKEKILDKKGKETKVPLAQKASSVLATLLRAEEMHLR